MALQTIRTHIAATHQSGRLRRHAELFADLIASLLSGATDLRTAVSLTLSQLGVDAHEMASMGANDGAKLLAAGKLPSAAFLDLPLIAQAFSLSCYVHEALPAVLMLAYIHSSDPEAGFLAVRSFIRCWFDSLCFLP